MRFAERFLVAFAVIALAIRLAGIKDGYTLELIALPLLAAFYLVAAPLVLFRRRRLLPLFAGIAAGAGLAYCIISLLLYTLRWLPRVDMLENCGIILALMAGGCAFAIRRLSSDGARQILWRCLALVIVIAMVACFPVPEMSVR